MQGCPECAKLRLTADADAKHAQATIDTLKERLKLAETMLTQLQQGQLSKCDRTGLKPF